MSLPLVKGTQSDLEKTHVLRFSMFYEVLTDRDSWLNTYSGNCEAHSRVWRHLHHPVSVPKLIC